jgi:phosphoribosyl-ATP pyrophosphohydrolase
VTVYVDDFGTSATVHNPATGRDITDRWSHLIADTQEELHRFAGGKLGLRRSYFQPGKPRDDGRPSPFWHYDLTSGKRWQAIRHGAVAVTSQEMNRIIAEREARARGPLEAMLREFHARIPPAVPARATPITDPGLRELRRRLLEEEVGELHDAVEAGDLAAIGKEAADVIYAAAGTAVAAGLPIDLILAAVHAANMTKDPGPDGKAVKGPGYLPADIAEVISKTWP